LYVAEQAARVSVEARANVQKQISLKEQEKRERDIRNIAQMTFQSKREIPSPIKSKEVR